jgi:hypothetical protein
MRRLAVAARPIALAHFRSFSAAAAASKTDVAKVYAESFCPAVAKAVSVSGASAALPLSRCPSCACVLRDDAQYFTAACRHR